MRRVGRSRGGWLVVGGESAARTRELLTVREVSEGGGYGFHLVASSTVWLEADNNLVLVIYFIYFMILCSLLSLSFCSCCITGVTVAWPSVGDVL